MVKVTNVAPSQKRIKFVPPASDVFTVSRVKYPSETSGDLATGMSLTMAVVFQAPSFADFDDAITFVTEEGAFKLPISARRDPPVINLVNPMNCLNSWLGDRVDMAFRCVNNGGDGTMNAAKANITGGIINATGSLGKIVIDADHQFIQFGNSGNTYNAYLMPRAVQGGTALILTGTTPFVGGSPYSYAVTDDLLNAHPYLSIGPTTNSFGKIMEGIGLYTTNAYINVTESNGIGISTVNNLSGSTYYANQILLSSGSLKLNSGTTTISNGVETNTKISSQMLVDSKTITLQTWTTDNVSTPTAGSQIVLGQGVVTIGARSSASGTGKIIVSDKYVTTQVSSSNFIVVGDISSQISSGSIDGSGVGNSGQTIVLQASNSRVNGVSSTSGTDGTNTYTSAYSGPSRIVLDSQYGVGIWGLPVQGNITIAKNTNTGYYMDTYPLGPYARQRMLVEDPATGQTKLGMAVYYSSSTEYNSAPTNSSGYVGDLWVIY